MAAGRRFDIALGFVRGESCRTAMDSISHAQSLAMAKEVLHDIGSDDGMHCFSVPDTGVWRIDTLSFQVCGLTDVILKRSETASFPVFAKFCPDQIPGETVCELSDGSPAITLDGETLHFAFNPFLMHFTNLNEGFRRSKLTRLKHSALYMYCHMPRDLRIGLRWAARRYRTSNIRSFKDLELLGVSSNVIIHMIEQHLRQRGLLRKQPRPPLAVVTHDIDTDFCQTEGREILSSIDQQQGVHATWFFVPRSFQYSLDRRGVRDLVENGHEIGMHGFAHDGKLALHSPAKLTKQLRTGKAILESIGSKVVSFRSPWTIRSLILPLTLASVGFKVDSSYPDTDRLSIAGRGMGVSYNRPFRPLIMKRDSSIGPLPLWEVPITGPQDVHLVEDFGLTDEQLFRLWKYKADFCRDFGGLHVLHVHPVHIVKRLEAYNQFLEYLRKNGFKFTTLRNIPEVWKMG
jgi:peptidoglycan/xylan/chitin deacetylase (PgdA/CDA1 family)